MDNLQSQPVQPAKNSNYILPSPSLPNTWKNLAPAASSLRVILTQLPQLILQIIMSKLQQRAQPRHFRFIVLANHNLSVENYPLLVAALDHARKHSAI
jgi:hypothetical protein